MGDPKRLRRKYSTPRHPWNKLAIDSEREIKREYGLTNKKEILIANSFLKKYKDIAKKLTASKTAQAEKEAAQVIGKLHRLGLLSAGAGFEQILGLELPNILDRRIQSVVYRKGLARSMKQARQFITHRHIVIEGKEITSPSYIISLEEEAKLGFKGKSALADENHPERLTEQNVKETKEEKKEKKVEETEDVEIEVPEDSEVAE